jgi:hypothetical protein
MNDDLLQPSEAFIAKQGRYYAIRNGLAMVVGVVLILMLALSAWSSWQTQKIAQQDSIRIQQNEEIQEFIREQAIRNGELNTQAREASLSAAKSAELIRSCVVPGGKCYQRQQEETGALLGVPEGPINTVVVAAISCADQVGVQTDTEIIRCVRSTLEQRRQ